ncbi:hypothetical protein [Neptuniibacter sp. QD34_54]|uniref:hypothetical protein n=1 Tax=Neptuniibacter sp. QD34_54 TaxID=3398208 RepID=UPI0039F51247
MNKAKCNTASKRKFINLPKSKQQSLRHEFATHFEALDTYYDTGESESVEWISVTVFDHWLSLDEAILNLDKARDETRKAYDEKLYTFICLLTSQFEAFLVKKLGRYNEKLTFREFTSKEGRKSTLILSDYRCGERARFSFVIPSLGILYFEGSDFTHHIYFKDVNALETIRPLVDRCKLFLLC